jgi:predicted HNH restriction endonuclease
MKVRRLMYPSEASHLNRLVPTVSRGEVCTWLRAAVAEQRRIDLSSAHSEAVVVEKPHSTVITSETSLEGDIRILLRADDEKKTKRNAKVIRDLDVRCKKC